MTPLRANEHQPRRRAAAFCARKSLQVKELGQILRYERSEPHSTHRLQTLFPANAIAGQSNTFRNFFLLRFDSPSFPTYPFIDETSALVVSGLHANA